MNEPLQVQESPEGRMLHLATAIRWLRYTAMQDDLDERERVEIKEATDWLLLHADAIRGESRPSEAPQAYPSLDDWSVTGTPHRGDLPLSSEEPEPQTVYLDLETTGLDPKHDEVLEIAILDEDGVGLLDTLVRPERMRQWPQAQEKHGIAPSKVLGTEIPTLHNLSRHIPELVQGKRVVIYNAPFDRGFLGDLLSGAAEIRCAMREFGDLIGSKRFISLEKALGHVQGGGTSPVAHRAREDCLAAREVWHWIESQRQRQGRDQARGLE